MSNRTNISTDRLYRDFFPKEVQSQIFLNDGHESSEVWGKQVDSKAEHFYQLSKEHWIFKVGNKKIIDWLSCFNNQEYQQVKNILDIEVTWTNDQEIYFFISSSISFSCSWMVFKENWSDFLCIDDECPIVICLSDPRTFIIFEISGRLLKLSK